MDSYIDFLVGLSEGNNLKRSLLSAAKPLPVLLLLEVVKGHQKISKLHYQSKQIISQPIKTSQK